MEHNTEHNSEHSQQHSSLVAWLCLHISAIALISRLVSQPDSSKEAQGDGYCLLEVSGMYSSRCIFKQGLLRKDENTKSTFLMVAGRKA